MSDDVQAQAPDQLSLADAAEMLWVVLANVSGGDWKQQTPEWQEAAARWRDAYFAAVKASAAPVVPPVEPPWELPAEQVQLVAWAVVNCHTLARRALANTTSVYDREKWEHVLRICEKAGARSQGVLRASVPTEMTEGEGRQ